MFSFPIYTFMARYSYTLSVVMCPCLSVKNNCILGNVWEMTTSDMRKMLKYLS